MKKKMTWSALVRFISRESSPEEDEIVTQWIAEDERHRQVVDETNHLTNSHHLEFPHFDVTRGKKILRSKMTKMKEITPATSRRLVWTRWAAIFLILSAASAYLFTKSLQVQNEIVTRAGEKYTFRLPDGTLAMLNADSRLTYNADFGKTHRKIALSGEAYLDVQPDKQKPFIIDAGELTIRVVGTAFHVKAHPDDNEAIVSVSEGVVRVESIETLHQQELTKNQRVTYDKKSKKLTKKETDLLLELAWMDNQFIFKNHTLVDVARALERSFGISIRFQNDKIKHCVVTGKFEETTLRKIIMSICYANDLEYEFREGYVLLKGKRC